MGRPTRFTLIASSPTVRYVFPLSALAPNDALSPCLLSPFSCSPALRQQPAGGGLLA